MFPPDDRDFDEEIRCHLAISARERIEDGEDPDTARLAALRELGYIPAIRESMRRVWYGRWFDAAVALWQDVRIASRSLRRAKGVAAAVVVTLAIGIGANAAIFSVVRGVLLRPLVNRDEDRLLYIRQAAPGIHAANTTFSVPEVNDLRSRVKTIGAFGEFSTVDFTLVGLGEQPRIVKAGVVNGAFFDVMGLRPVLGRLLNAHDEGPDAAGAAVLTYRFWATELGSDPAVIGRTIRLGPRTATVVGVLEPSVPYPADTEIIANVVTSPHHLGATMETIRTHRMTELFGRLAPGATIESARAELAGAHAAMMREHPESYPSDAGIELRVTRLRDQLAAPARTILLLLLGAAAIVFVVACSNVANLILARSVRREGELAIRAALGAGPAALRRALLAEALVLCSAGAVLGVVLAKPFLAVVSRYAARFSIRALDVTLDGTVSVDRRGAGDRRRRAARVRASPAIDAGVRRPRPGQRHRADHAGDESTAAHLRDRTDRVLVRAVDRRRHAARHAGRAAARAHRLRRAPRAGLRRADGGDRRRLRRSEGDRVLRGSDAARWRARACRGGGDRQLRPVARCRHLWRGRFILGGRTQARSG